MSADVNHSPSASPHAHDRSSIDRLMLRVCLALTPVTLWGFYCFGWPAIILFAVTTLAAIVTEMGCLYLMGQPISRVKDNSAMLTGWMLALTLPPWAPWWIGVGGAFFAIAIGKQIYGGIGQNLFNPALLARIALLISFPVQLTTWVNVTPLNSPAAPDFITSVGIIFAGAPLADGMTGATWLGAGKAAAAGGAHLGEMIRQDFSLHDAFFGLTRGSMGETSELLALLGGLYLLIRRVISWHIPVALLGTLALLALVSEHVNPDSYAGPLFHLTSGGVMIGAFFYATEYVTSPSTPAGKIIFGIGCGALLFAIRSWGGFPEAVAFAILLMNTFTPLIDRAFKPRAYGRTRAGNAIKHVSAARKVV
ncbi:MAG: RnfABCDGE type electron transport complex subunit D [Pseudomonadota bacterium]|nr:RnfABCDGE type electron transport complex subunit D [Pseudomonadota bacterium]